ncbi:hypothetical protein J2X31_000498 [Flavobacterium arsenatis]|uniref:Secretion system C-terminal sorting domain-containing protein n=1 Tax=Flavobacterium arsenatis TaxID=1484332 RepID=A0ABU1TKK0_9FLAO|nr:choice-of-anchor L domain-containing protein [Flavobacterium arsenatis]MDR6966505.1 hypothetical protein [Flavobacterium arsenatis]
MKKQLLFFILLLCIGLQIGNAKDNPLVVVETNLTNPPINDECENAINVAINPTSEIVSFVSGTTVGATYSATSGSCVANQNDIWYSFVATSTMHFFKFYNVVYFQPSNQLSYQVFSGSDCGTLTPVVCGYGEESMVNNLVVGQAYKVRVYSSIQVVTFAFDFAIFTTDPLINDECSNAINIPVNPDMTTDLFLNTTDLGATNSANTGNCYNEKDTWYHFTALSPTHSVRFFDLDNNQIFKTFSLFTGENCSSLIPVACISNGVLENLTVGTTYTIKLIKNTIQSLSQSSFKIIINSLEAPLNDDCENVITVLANPDLQKNFFVAGSTAGATPSNMDSTDRDVYYRFIATSTQHLIYFDNIINTIQFEILQENSNCANSTLLYPFEGMNSTFGTVYSNFIVGNAYVIRVKSSAEDLSAVFDLSIRTHQPVTNVGCLNSIEVPVNPTTSCDEFIITNTQAGTWNLNGTMLPSDATWYHFVATSKTHTIQFEDLDGVFSGPNFVLYNNDACDTNQGIGYSYVQGLKGYYNNLIIGNEYKIRLNTENYLAPVSGQVKVCITTIPQPEHDECANAISLQVNAVNQTEYFVNSSTFGATNSDVPNTCNDSADDDVWFSFVATSKFHTITLSNVNPIANNLKLAVYEGADCASMFLKRCGNNSVPLNTLTIGQSYKIRVYTESQGVNMFASFTIAVSTNALAVNDECSNAILVPTSTISDLNAINASVKGATQSSEENNCVPEADDDVWYEFIATATRHTINFDWSSSFAILINFAVYTGDCDNLTQVFCSTVGVNTLNDLIIGQAYKIRIWSAGSNPTNATYKLIITNQDEPLIANTTQFTSQELISDILITDPCIAVSNITSSTGTNFGSVNGIGYFTNNNPLFPISSGIILSTGNAANAGGPNPSISSEGNSSAWANAGDEDLNATILEATGTPIVSKNATKLEFDFTTQNDFMSFNFLFASEDYGVYQCIPGDAFAFLLTDLTTGTITNLAVVPGTQFPISVNTIRDMQYNTSCPSTNEGFFGSLYGGLNEGLFSPINFIGHTALMTASASIVPNNPYHIKLVIADRGFITYDSAVFIQAGSFTSGQSQCLDRIELVAFIDDNNNGIKEDSEINFTNGSFAYQINDAVDSIEVSSSNGLHTIFGVNPLDSYDITYNIQSEFTPYYSGTTSFDNITIPEGSGTQTLYFPITQIEAFTDLSVSIIPLGQPVAGSSYANKVVYQNMGNIAASGIINYTKDVSVTVSTAESGVVLTPTGFTYNFENLTPFETRSFIIQMNVPAGRQMIESTPLSSNISISSSSGDIDSSNNSFQISQGLVSEESFIHKTESHGSLLDITTFTEESYLYYTIYFQNKATISVNNIRIEDVLDAQLDEESIQTVSASHSFTMKRIGNEVTWNFDYVYLPSYLENSDSSSGYVTFKIKLKPGFEAGDIIPNSAEIYFDNNPPIITNTFNSTFEEQLSTPEFSSGNLLMYPNPSNGMVYINTQNTTENLKEINLYDVLGKIILSTKDLSSKQSTLNVGSLVKGVYMVEITTENNFKQTKKLIVN